VFIGNIQFVLFLCAGAVVGPLQNLNPASYARPMNVCGVILWALGYGVSVAVRTDTIAFTAIFVLLGGLGSGILFWNTHAMVRSWSSVSAYAILYFIISLAPDVYMFIFTSIVANLLNTPETGSLWYDTYVGTTTACSVILLICASCLTPGPFAKTKTQAPGKQERTALLTLLTAVFAFQAAYFVPYTYITPYMVQRLGESSEHAAYVMTAVSGGAMVGKCLSFPVGIALDLEFVRVGTASLTAVFALGTMITLFAWLACTTYTVMVVFGVFYGLFSAGTLLLVQYVCAVTWGASWDHNTRIAWICIARTLGELTAALTCRYGLLPYGVDAPVYFAACLCLCASLLFISVVWQLGA